MNAKIGLEDTFSSVTGKYSLHKESNGNGELTCEYVAANDMYIMSKKFNHKKIHNGTWVAPDGNTCNQIDHVLVNQNKSSMIQGVRTLRRPSCDSDHYLVKTVITQKLVRALRNTVVTPEENNGTGRTYKTKRN
jgi:hypothetical protein